MAEENLEAGVEKIVNKSTEEVKEEQEDEVQPDDIQIDIEQQVVEPEEVKEQLPALESAVELSEEAEIQGSEIVTLKNVLFSMVLYHHRVISCFIRHKTQSHRPVQALSLITQMFIAGATFSMMKVAGDKIFHTNMESAPVTLTIIGMRFC